MNEDGFLCVKCSQYTFSFVLQPYDPSAWVPLSDRIVCDVCAEKIKIANYAAKVQEWEDYRSSIMDRSQDSGTGL